MQKGTPLLLPSPDCSRGFGKGRRAGWWDAPCPPFPITPGGAEPSSGSGDAAAPGPPASSLLHPFPSPQPGPPRPAGTRLPVRGGSDEVMLLNIAISSQPFSPATRPGCRRLPALAEPPPASPLRSPPPPLRRRSRPAAPGMPDPKAGGGGGDGTGTGTRCQTRAVRGRTVPGATVPPAGHRGREDGDASPTPTPLRLPTWV